MDAEGRLELAESVAQRLSQVPGVDAVVLGGSLARGRAGPDSDIDLGLYYRAARAPDLGLLRAIAADLNDNDPNDDNPDADNLDSARSGEVVTDFGAWGPWINGGAWLRLGGQPVDWLYRDLDKVERTLAACLRGRLERHAQPGHPHGFHSHIYLGELFCSRALHDATGVIARLKAQLTPYPASLRAALVRTFLWQADFALAASEKAVARAESSYAAGCFFESAYDLVQVLFALNGRYFVNEKGAVGETEAFAVKPARFAATVSEVLAQPGADAEMLGANLRRLRRLAAEVGRLSR